MLPSKREAGNAQVEFVGVVVVLLIPIVYFIVTVARVQAANLAATSAAHAIARDFALSSEPSPNTSIASEIATLAFEDQGLATSTRNLSVQVSCDSECARDALVQARVSYDLKLPLLSWVPGAVTIEGTGFSYRGELRATE